MLLDFDTYTVPGDFVYTQADRDDVQSRIEADYHGPDPSNWWFDVSFTQNIADIPQNLVQTGQYATLYFNRTPSFDLPGGESSEIDFGNLDLSGYGSIQINGLVGGVNQPTATTENYDILSAKIGGMNSGT